MNSFIIMAWAKKYVEDKFNQFSVQLQPQIVEKLPAVGEPNYIYLVRLNSTDENNLFEEYLYIDKKWEKIGMARIPLEDYVTLEALEKALSTQNELINETQELASSRAGKQMGSYNELYNYENADALSPFRGNTIHSHVEGYLNNDANSHYIEDSSYAHLEGMQNKIVTSNGAHASGEWHIIENSNGAAAFGGGNYI